MRDARAGRWLAALVAIAVLLPSRASIPLAALVVLVVGGSGWWVRHVARRLHVGCTVPRWASPDEDIEAVVEVRNASRLPAAWIEVDVPSALGLGRTAAHREAVTLLPDASRTSRVPLRCLRRGVHHVGPPRLRVGDVLGVADARTPPPEPAHVTVFPRIVPLERLGLPAQSPFVTVPSRWSLLTDPASVVGVRDYEVGDPFTAIHWTATARTQRLVVKQYERAESRDTLVCLDLSPQGYPKATLRASTELAITVAASVLHHCVVRQRLPAGLVVPAWAPSAAQPVLQVPPRADEGHLRRALELLAVVQPRAERSLPEVLANLDRGLAAGTTVLAVTGRLDADLSAHLLRLARAGVAVAVALTGPSAAGDVLTVGDLWLPVYRVVDLPSVTRLAA